MAAWFLGSRRRRGKSLPVAFFWLVSGLVYMLLTPLAAAQHRDSDTRALKIYFVQTQEKDEIVFKQNGRYVRSGLRRLNYILRDWRRNEPVAMDPRLFDLVWQIYRLSGSKDYIHVVSGYRSPQTNAMLRLGAPAGTVARHSRHMEGQAMDFYLPDTSPAYLRALALKLQGGGIGYYPASASPFVHVDVGSVRHWPRMSRQALAALFPDGKSLHVPSDGRPLPHYEDAAAEYKQRGAAAVPAVSARALLAGLSPQQAALAAADGHLPAGRYGDNAGALPPVLAPVAPAPAIFAFARVPIPAAAPVLAAEAEELLDEADSKAAFIPVPRFKNTVNTAGNSGNNALLAYAPPDRAETGLTSRALQALSDIAPIPAAKPLPAAGHEAASSAGAPAARAAAAVVPLPQARPPGPGAAVTAEAGRRRGDKSAKAPAGRNKARLLAAGQGAAAPLHHIPLPQRKGRPPAG